MDVAHTLPPAVEGEIVAQPIAQRAVAPVPYRFFLTPLALVVVLAAFALGQLPLLSAFLGDLGNREQYAFYPLLLAAGIFLVASRLKEVPALSLRFGAWSAAALMWGLSLGLYMLGAGFYMRWFAAPAALLALGGLVWRLGGPTVARALVPVGVLLLVIVPPPFHLDDMLTRSLQRLAVRGSSGMLDLLHVPHVMTGTVLEIPGHRLMVEEACSGINSLLSVVAFTLLFAFLRRRSAVAIVALLAAAVWFVLWANVGRITIGAFAQARYGVNLLDGSVHEMSGLVLFGVCLGLVISTDQFLQLVGERIHLELPRRRRPQGRARVPRASGLAAPVTTQRLQANGTLESPVFASPGWRWWAFAAAFACVGVWTHLRIKDCWPVSRMPGSITLAPPTHVGKWELIHEGTSRYERTESFAKYIHRWHYRGADGSVAEISLAYPFTTGYHDPAVCYTSAGWSVAGRAAKDARGETGEVLPVQGATPYFEMDLSNLAGRHGLVLFAAFDERGQWQSPPTDVAPRGSLSYRIWLSERVAMFSPTHEVQTLVVSPAPLNAGQKQDVEELFLEVRGALARQSLDQLAGRGNLEGVR